MPGLRPPITIVKRTPEGREVWRYSGEVLQQGDSRILVEARFNRDDLPFMGTTLRRGDRFVETYFTDRWYNMDEIHDREDDQLKGWYCNIATPAVIENGVLSYADLALDLWVTPEGQQTVLDEDEFEALEIDDATRKKALAALEELKRLFGRKA